jgi:RNA polymerase sigma-70 factor, ECF subfamily
MVPHEDILTDTTRVLLPALRAYAYSLTRSPWEADDLVQETLLKALANVSRFELGSDLRSWLFAIMRNSFRNNLKRSHRESLRNAASLAQELTLSGSQEDSSLLRETARALVLLSPEYQEVIILVGALGLSHEDAASVTGSPLGTVKSRLSRAREQLGLLLDES